MENDVAFATFEIVPNFFMGILVLALTITLIPRRSGEGRTTSWPTPRPPDHPRTSGERQYGLVCANLKTGSSSGPRLRPGRF